MNYLQFKITNLNDLGEVLVAELSEAGFEGFEEQGDELYAYIKETDFQSAVLEELAEKYGFTSSYETIAPQNWNATWESNFEPIVIDDFCTIRASFHDIPINTTHEILITPKMSFGTGHHATTQLVIRQMRDINFGGKKVLDFGTGTGVLAILAEMLGAKAITAIDNDSWSFENATENVGNNNCKCISVGLGSIEDYQPGQYDIILANINRHILLEYMPLMQKMLNNAGTVIMSGLLEEDEGIILEHAKAAGFEFLKRETSKNWLVLVFKND